MKQDTSLDGLQQLPTDGYSRFFVILRLLEELYKDSAKTIKILDVGGCSPYLRQGLEASGRSFELTIVDILPKPADVTSPYIQDDVTTSDLPDNSFDVVVTTDVMEHIPKDRKRLFVKACVRLATDIVILAAPFDTEGVDYAEHHVNDFNKQLFGIGQDWLEEHFEFTKPTKAQVVEVLDELAVPYADFGVNNLYSWLLTTHLNLIEAKVGLDARQVKKIQQTYNTQLSGSVEFVEPTYRHFFVIFKSKKLQDKTVASRVSGSPQPQQFADFIHDMMQIVYQRIVELDKVSVAKSATIEHLERQLANERLHTEKLHQQMVTQQQELEQLRPFRRLVLLRHPGGAPAAIKRRIKR
jgi:uncharacterized coiled-coil protein SlyX